MGNKRIPILSRACRLVAISANSVRLPVCRYTLRQPIESTPVLGVFLATCSP